MKQFSLPKDAGVVHRLDAVRVEHWDSVSSSSTSSSPNRLIRCCPSQNAFGQWLPNGLLLWEMWGPLVAEEKADRTEEVSLNTLRLSECSSS